MIKSNVRTLVLFIVTSIPPLASACGVDLVASDRSARTQIHALAATLPKYFRFEVTYDEGRRLVVAEPKCVTTWRSERDLWRSFAARQRFGIYGPTWRLKTRVPSTTLLMSSVKSTPPRGALAVATFELGAQTNNVIELTYDRLAHDLWRGRIIRDQPTGQPLSLTMDLPSCSATAVNTFSYRLSDGRRLSPAQWREWLRTSPENQSCSM